MDSTGCVGSTIKLLNGKYIDLQDPDPDCIDSLTIATALSRICRFGGHCPEYYSVAEHSMIAAELALGDNISPGIAKAILLHDAAEAFLGDIVKPLKNLLPKFQEIEAIFESAIASRFCVDFDSHREIVKFYDHTMLKAEKLSMWPSDGECWEGFASIPCRDVKFNYLGPRAAGAEFLLLLEWIEKNE